MRPQHTPQLFEGHGHLLSLLVFVSCVLSGLELSFHSYLPRVHFGGGTLLRLPALGCRVWAVTGLCGEATRPLYFTLNLWLQNQSKSPLSPITAALPHPRAVAKSCLNVLGSFFLAALLEVNSHREVPPTSRN